MRKRMTLGLAMLGALGMLAMPVRQAGACETETTQVRRVVDTVYCHTADTYRVRVARGSRVCLAVQANGEFALLVFDECGHVVATDSGCEESRALVRFSSRRTAVFTVKVVNRDTAPVDYVLVAD